MLGLMQDQPLLISSLIEFAARHHARRRDRLATRRRRHAPLHLPPGRGARAPGGQRARPAGAGVLRPRRHAGVERLPPLRAVFRRLGQRARGAHPQPAPGARAGGVDRQPCRRPGAVLRHDLPADRQGDLAQCTTVKHWIALCDADALPADTRHRRPAELRSVDRQRAAPTYEWPEFDEKQRLRALLHQRHHRQPEGRALQPPLDAAACLWRRAARCAEHLGARHASCRWCRCSTSTPGAFRMPRR